VPIDSTPPSVPDAQDLQRGTRLVGIVGKVQGLEREAGCFFVVGLVSHDLAPAAFAVRMALSLQLYIGLFRPDLSLLLFTGHSDMHQS
jgi:hypothetical protein